MAFDYSTLVRDRTQADVATLQIALSRLMRGELSQEDVALFYSATSKGAYNYTDLNRVGLAIQDLAQRLTATGYLPQQEVRTDWSATDIMRPEDANKYLSALRSIRSQHAQQSSTPYVPTDMSKLTVSNANAIEQILYDVERVLNSINEIKPRVAQHLMFCGFGVYPKHTLNLPPKDEWMQVYTADGLQVYTADGLAVYVKK